MQTKNMCLNDLSLENGELDGSVINTVGKITPCKTDVFPHKKHDVTRYYHRISFLACYSKNGKRHGGFLYVCFGNEARFKQYRTLLHYLKDERFTPILSDSSNTDHLFLLLFLCKYKHWLPNIPQFIV